MGIDFTNIMHNKTSYLSMEEIKKMLDYCFDNDLVRDYMLILTLARTGRRVTEIVGEKPYIRKVGLRPCDIHPDGLIEFDILKKMPIKHKSPSGTKRSEEYLIRARTKKMPKRKLQPVDNQYLNILKRYIQAHNITPHQRIFPITRRRVNYIIERVSTKTLINRSKGKIHAHMFRHSLAINLLKDNPNDASIIKQIQQLLDHSKIDVTYHYAQFTPEDKRKSLNKLFNTQ